MFKGKSANFTKEGPFSTSVQEQNHCESMETESNSKTMTANCLNNKPHVKEADTVQEKAEHVSISPRFVDLNSCEETEPEPDEVLDKQKEMVNHTDFKKDVAVIGNENWVGTHKERFCEKTTGLAFNFCDNEDISCVPSSYVELSKITSLGPEFLPSGSSNCPNLTQGKFSSLQ